MRGRELEEICQGEVQEYKGRGKDCQKKGLQEQHPEGLTKPSEGEPDQRSYSNRNQMQGRQLEGCMHPDDSLETDG